MSPTNQPNAWCLHLGIAVPRLEDVLARKPRTNVREAMIVTLLERGEPLSAEELATRLESAGFASPDMVQSVRKAWRGTPPIVKEAERYAIDVHAPDIGLTLFMLGIDGSERPKPAPTPAAPPERGPDEPLGLEELRAALDCSSIRSLSMARTVAAVLEAHGHAMSVAEVEALLAPFVTWRGGINEAELNLARPRLVRLAGGELTLDRSDPAAEGALSALRTRIRKWAGPRLRDQARRAVWAEQRAAREAAQAERDRAELAAAARRRRVLLRVLPAAGDVRAGGLVDLEDRSVRLFVADQLPAVLEVLSSYQVVVGLEPRDALVRLGLDPLAFERLIDLRPIQKTRTVGGGRRQVKLETEDLIEGSIGIHAPFGTAREVERLLNRGTREQLAERLVSDLEGLFGYYRYGVLHGEVVLVRRNEGHPCAVSWSMPGDMTLRKLCVTAQDRRVPIDLVLTRPDLLDPWGKAVRGMVHDVGYDGLVLRGPRGAVGIPWHQVREARLAPIDAHAVAPEPPPPSTPRVGADQVLRLRVTLEEIEPPIWRELELLANTRLDELHNALQAVMGWQDCHLHMFEQGAHRWTDLSTVDDDLDSLDERDMTVGALVAAPGDAFHYEYDFGDSWRHEVRLVAVAAPELMARYPRCVGGARSCPPEDVGGVPGYEEFLEVITDPRHEDHAQLLTWAGGSFDPEAFSAANANRRLWQYR